MAGKKGTNTRWGYRLRNGEKIAGTKAGKKRTRLPYGHHLRTHDGPYHKSTTRRRGTNLSDLTGHN
jgi:hypothetical protein